MKTSKKTNVLRAVRIAVAAFFFAFITLLFLDFTGSLHKWFGWMAKMQFIPAVFAANFVVIAILLLVTLLCGRVYCSVICPLGILQDIASWTRGRLRKKDRFRFSYSPAKKVLRWSVMAVFIAACLAGIGSLTALLDPYGAYGRIAENLLSPIWRGGNNLLAYFAERLDSYAFYRTDVWIKSLPVFAVAAGTFVLVVILAWRSGRTYCNTICPVGTLLGAVSRFSLLKVRIDTDKCRNCGLCAKQCKASCIDTAAHKIDYSRCVACMDCIGACRDGAISYCSARPRGKAASGNAVPEVPGKATSEKAVSGAAGSAESGSGADKGRRAFLTTAAIAAGAAAAKAQEMKVDGGLTPVTRKTAPQRKVPITPAGSSGAGKFHARCTACQLCVAACPSNVLRPSMSLKTFMQPEMSYERGYCRPECTECSQVCPAGAILPLTPEEKSAISIGTAVTDYSLCLPHNGEASCGNCARHCPAGAIRMVRKDPDNENSLRIPAVDPERCIGCGACENLCPASPVSAIRVEGNEIHHII